MSFVEAMQQLEAIVRGTDKDVNNAPAAVAAKLDALDFANGDQFSTKLQAQTLEEELKAIGSMTNIDPRIRAAALRAEQRIEGELLAKQSEGLVPNDNAKSQVAALPSNDDDAPQPTVTKKRPALLEEGVAASALLRRRAAETAETRVDRLIETATRSPDPDIQISAMKSLETTAMSGFRFSPANIAALTALAFDDDIKNRDSGVRQKAGELSVGSLVGLETPHPENYQHHRPLADTKG